MGKVGIGIGIFVLIILIVGGLIAYSYTQISVTLSDVSYHSIQWETFSWSVLLKLGLNVLSGNWLGAAFDLIRGINLDLEFGLYNGGFLPVYIPDLSYNLYINDVYVGKGYSEIEKTISPGQTKKIDVLQNFQKNDLAPAVSSIISNNGVIELKVKGTAHFKLFVIDIPIPFESTKSISIKDEIRNKLNSEIQKNKPVPKEIVESVGKTVGSALGAIAKELFSADDLNLVLSGQTFVDSTYKVSPDSYYYIPFTLPCTANIQGGFIASAALGDNIMVYIMDEEDFRKYDNGQNFSIYYESGKVESGVFDMVLSSGDYYIVLSNTYSSFSTKTVQLQVAGACN